MPTTTPNLGLSLPIPNVDTGWGTTLNTDFTLIDNLFPADGSGTSVGVNVGANKTLSMGGTMILGTGDGTGTITPPVIRGASYASPNATGVNLTIDASNGTGTGGSGSIIFRTALPSATSGNTPNTLQNAVSIGQSSMYLNLSGSFLQTGPGTTGAVALRQPAGDATPAYLQWVNNNSTDQKGFINFSPSYDFIVAPAGVERVRVGQYGNIGLSGANYGTAGQVLTSGGSFGAAYWSNPSYTQLPAQTFAAGGNSFTGIPSTANNIIISIYACDPTANVLVRLGSGSFATTGYTSTSSSLALSASTATATNGILINSAADGFNGNIRLVKTNGNRWVADYTMFSYGAGRTLIGGGTISLAGSLDRVQVIPASGTLAASGVLSVFYL